MMMNREETLKHLSRMAERRKQMRLDHAEAEYLYDLAVLATIFGDDVQLTADLGQANRDLFVREDSTEILREPEIPKTYADYPDVTPALPDDIKQALKELKVTIDDVPGIGHALSFIELGLNNVQSSHVSAVACDMRVIVQALDRAIAISRLFVRYKGGGLYRYYPQPMSRMNDIVRAIRTMKNGGRTTLTVGEYIERVVKKAHDTGKCICERFNPQTGKWEVVLTKEQKAALKSVPKGQEEAIYLSAQYFADRIKAEIGDLIPSAPTPETQEADKQIEDAILPQAQETPPESVEPPEAKDPAAPMEIPTEAQLPESVPTTENAPQVQAEETLGDIGEHAVF